MNKIIDARGKNCPIPVIMAKKEIDSNIDFFTLLVDNETAVENLKRLANNSDYETKIVEDNSDFKVEFTREASADRETKKDSDKTWAVFVGREGIGDGDIELGSSLLKMFFYTLTQDENIPSYILFMNDGVKATTNNDQVIEQLITLSEMGAVILVCGTCLNYYNITDKLKIGTVSNMYDIVNAMKAVDKVITL
ncbi:MAG: sulfurtransferase-like selenium metabolism protein YedF [Clostridiales bacterium]|nr:sulfurtransferase-like selenium metabolism protein YedF [Clostridiales bacterium]